MSLSEPSSRLPARPSLEQLHKRAKDLLRDARAGDRVAADRIAAVAGARGATEIKLADAQLTIARELGFKNWAALVHHVESLSGAYAVGLEPLIRPIELTGSRPMKLADGTETSTDTVFEMFVAARDGDLARVRRLLAKTPALATVEYNYTPPIHFAAREGHLPIVELLLERGADLAYRSYPFGEALLTLAEDHEHADVAAFLRERLARRFSLGANVARIIAASRDGDVAIVRAELGRDASLARASNETGDTALHQASHGAHAQIVRVLLAAGANADAVRGDGYRPIHCALIPNWIMSSRSTTRDEIANALLAAGASYTVYIAALLGDISFVRDALRRDRSLANFEDSCHHRPISAAVRRNDLAMVRLLLGHGADPNLPEEGAPRGLALWMAVDQMQHDTIRLLLAHGADPNAEVESSGTPFGHARKNPELTELLRAHGGRERSGPLDHLARSIGDGDLAGVERFLRAHPELVHDQHAHWGDGILAGPAHAGNHELIALLVRLGARVPPVSKWAPYYYFKHEATAAFLLELGMDPNHMNWHRFTLLHHMAAEGEMRKAQLLLDHGAAIDAIDDEYRSTPLGVAARRGQRDMVALLLQHGADPSVAGAPWATPLAWARRKRHAEVEEMLLAQPEQ